MKPVLNMEPAGSTGQAGFSIIEVVAVIVVMGIMVVGLMDFINNSARGYVQTAARNQVSAAGRVVIDRIAMELHNALPFSVRTSTPHGAPDDAYGYENDQCLEFIPIQAATTYINPVFRPTPVSAAAFDVVNLVPTQVGETGRYGVIYPTTEADLYQDAFTDTEAIVAVTIADAVPTDGINEITPAAAHRFKRRSAEERLFIVTEPISYCVSGSKLYRYADYGFHATQLIPVGPTGACATATCLPAATPDRALVTDQLDNSILSGGPFDYLATNRRRNGVIQLELNFNQDDQQVRLNHEVLQQATP